MSDESTTATLEAPSGPATEVGTPAAPVAAPESTSTTPPPASEPKAPEQPTEKTSRVSRHRDPTTKKWVKTGTQGSEVVTPRPKPAFDDAAYRRAEEAGLTRYQVGKLGSPEKLEAELARRAASKPVAPAAPETPAPSAPKATAPAAPATPGTAASDAEWEAVLKLPPLDPELYSAEEVARDKAYRAFAQRALDDSRQLQTLRDEFGELKKRAQEDEQRRQAEVVRKESRQVDEVLNGLGEEFAPIFGKGTFETLPAGYAEARNQVYGLATFGQQFLPDVPLEKLAERAAAFLYFDEFQQRHERELIKRAKESAASRGFSGAAIERPQQPYVGPSKNNPAIKEKVRQLRLRRQGLAPLE